MITLFHQTSRSQTDLGQNLFRVQRELPVQHPCKITGLLFQHFHHGNSFIFPEIKYLHPFFVIDDKSGKIHRVILWIGEYSMGIFLTHWLVIASFSCWFYSIYSEAGEKLAIGVNLVLSYILIGICSKVYVWLVDGKIFPCVWKCAKNILKENR